jgi:hypothetical protein
MKELERKFRKGWIVRLGQGLVLMASMVAIGTFTAYASANTFEVIMHRDIAYSSVIRSVGITQDKLTNQALVKALDGSYQTGSFGLPKKIKLPETNKHLDLVGPIYEGGQWKASSGIGETFLTANPRQKMFGQAVIYLRVDTATTHNLGDVLVGDIVNIVTTEGWQLGYKVDSVADDVSAIYPSSQTAASEILVVMVDDETGATHCFKATLLKVGERI